MELRENLELVEVVYSDTKKKVTLTFLDEENGQVLDVIFNKQAYENEKFVDSEEKEEDVKKWCQDYFGTTFEKLSDAIGVRKNVYMYDKFNSLWESEFKQVNRFSEDLKGEIFNTVIEDVYTDSVGIKIGYNYEDNYYESKMKYATYVEARKQWFESPQEKDKQYKKFKEKFGVDVEDCKSIIGKPIMVEVKMTGKYTWGDIKKPKWDK